MNAQLFAQISSSFGINNRFVKIFIVIAIAILAGWMVWFLFGKLCDWWTKWRSDHNQTDI